MKFFPAFLSLGGRRCLVVGGGELAARKIRLLLRAGAEVTVVAPKAGAEIAELAARGEIAWIRRRFVADDVRGSAVVHGATGRAAVDAGVSAAAYAAGIQVNVVDRPELSSFTVPAIVDRDPVVIGISSGGTAPVLARRLRTTVEALLPARLGRLARFAASFRTSVKAIIPDAAARLRF
ncbi:MAG: bifunctional precorrin-2 dehydrogenase/sirohydrochlorin ferrochelatase [Kiloniellaceae bacterium]